MDEFFPAFRAALPDLQQRLGGRPTAAQARYAMTEQLTQMQARWHSDGSDADAEVRRVGTELVDVLKSALKAVDSVSRVDVLFRPGAPRAPAPRPPRAPVSWLVGVTAVAAFGLLGLVLTDPAPGPVTVLALTVAVGLAGVVAVVRTIARTARTARPASEPATPDYAATAYVDSQQLTDAVGDTLLTVDTYLRAMRSVEVQDAAGDLWLDRPRLVGVIQDLLAREALGDWTGVDETARRLRQVLKDDAVEPVSFTGSNAGLFEFVRNIDEPDRVEPLTVTPALVRNGQLLARGLVAEPQR